MVDYMLGFLLFAAIQSILELLFSIFILQIGYRGNLAEVIVFLFMLSIVGVRLGIFISTFTRNEFQVMQFIPIIIIPQIFLRGVIVPVRQMPTPLEVFAQMLPLTYAVDGIQNIMLKGDGLGDVMVDIAALGVFGAIFISLATMTLRRGQ